MHGTVSNPSAGMMQIMDPSGHTSVTWDINRPDEVDAARATFDQLIAKGYRAFRATSDGGQGGVMTTFDPKAGKLIMAPHLVGG